MSGPINAEAYRKLCEEDLAWLMTVPRTLEREHIAEILKWHIEHAKAAIQSFKEIEERKAANS